MTEEALKKLDRIMRKLVYGLYSNNLEVIYEENGTLVWIPREFLNENKALVKIALLYLKELKYVKEERNAGRIYYKLNRKNSEKIREIWITELTATLAKKLNPILDRMIKKIEELRKILPREDEEEDKILESINSAEQLLTKKQEKEEEDKDKDKKFKRINLWLKDWF
ncbi:MAG: hypothetical protein ACTSSJ_05185 [Candidatus Odinarchaeia archaeon]